MKIDPGATSAREVSGGSDASLDLEAIRDLDDADTSAVPATASVSVVIPCYNHARFLSDAVASVRAQTVRPAEIIVVDDGSTDETAAVAQAMKDVTYVRQANAGLSGARNTGLARAAGEYVLFLDADDILLPDALENGLACFARHPECAFVFGGHVGTDVGGTVLWETRVAPPQASYAALLGANVIGMHAAVLYRRDILKEAGGFDRELRVCEDYDVYLRLAAAHPIACHDTIVAEYRQHGENMSHDSQRMLTTTLQVLRSHEARATGDPSTAEAYRQGLAHYQSHYGLPIITDALKALSRGEIRSSASHFAAARQLAPRAFLAAPAHLSERVLPRLKQAAPPWLRRFVGRVRGRPATPPVGLVDFGDLRRVNPIDPDFGHERGAPVDRYYVERFLERHREDIKGRVLEVGDDQYTRRYGETRVAQSDVLNLKPGHPKTTIIGDLASADHIPDGSFDCIVLTQTLHLVFELQKAAATLARILKPGGVLLLTVPGISQIDRGEWGDAWHWSLTAASVKRLFGALFSENIAVETHGNVLVATAFLHGLAASELTEAELAAHDRAYQVLITLRAVKPRSDPA